MTTRADAEAEIIARIGRWLTAAGLDGTTVSGSNASLNSPISYALRDAGVSAVTSLADSALDRFYDLAELRALDNAVQNFTKVDVKAAAVEAQQDDLGQRMERARNAKRAYVAAVYGVGGAAAFSVGMTRTDGFSELAELDDA